jgi:hypothetical protein
MFCREHSVRKEMAKALPVKGWYSTISVIDPSDGKTAVRGVPIDPKIISWLKYIDGAQRC